MDQLPPRYSSFEDSEPGDTTSDIGQAQSTVLEQLQDTQGSEKGAAASQQNETNCQGKSFRMKRPNPRMPIGDESGPDRPRRSERLKNQKR